MTAESALAALGDAFSAGAKAYFRVDDIAAEGDRLRIQRGQQNAWSWKGWNWNLHTSPVGRPEASALPDDDLWSCLRRGVNHLNFLERTI